MQHIHVSASPQRHLLHLSRGCLLFPNSLYILNQSYWKQESWNVTKLDQGLHVQKYSSVVGYLQFSGNLSPTLGSSQRSEWNVRMHQKRNEERIGTFCHCTDLWLTYSFNSNALVFKRWLLHGTVGEGGMRVLRNVKICYARRMKKGKDASCWKSGSCWENITEGPAVVSAVKLNWKLMFIIFYFRRMGKKKNNTVMIRFCCCCSFVFI